MPMREPPHPGLCILLECMEPLGLNISEAAKVLGVDRRTLGSVVNGKGRITAELAVRLSKAFGSSTETWLRMQLAYDLAQINKIEKQIKVQKTFTEKDLIEK